MMTMAYRIGRIARYLYCYNTSMFRHLCNLRKYGTANNPTQVLRSALDENSKKKIEMVPFRISACRVGDCFTDAELILNEYLIDRYGDIKTPNIVLEDDAGKIGTYGVDFNSLFSKGVKALRTYVDGDLGSDSEFVSDPFRNRLQLACETLSTFLGKSGYHGKCLSVMDGDDEGLQDLFGTETVITVLLANHLFSRLTTTELGGYYIGNDSRTKVTRCLCDCNDPIVYAGSGFGSRYLWYGKPDIVLYPAPSVASLNVVVPSLCKHHYQTIEWNDVEEAQMTEMKSCSSALRNKENVRQIVAQTITFSFYQHKFAGAMYDESPETYLVPTIAVCSDSFDVYMYDPKNDILLRNEGEPIEFRYGEHLCLGTVLKLWILANHLFVRPSLDDHDFSLLRGSCGLHKLLNQHHIDKINQTISMRESFPSVRTSKPKIRRKFNER